MSTTESTTQGTTGIAGARAAEVKNLRVLKAPEEGGTKKDYEDFLEKIQNHVLIAWEFGKDVGYVVKNGEMPDIKQPTDLSEEDVKVAWKTCIWNHCVDRYALQMDTLTLNLGALYTLLMGQVSKIVRAKVKSKKGYTLADESNNAIWLLGVLEDIMINFEESKPKLLAIDDQMERIMKLKQGDATNEDFIKLVSKELKIYEKHGGDFLWGTTQIEKLSSIHEKEKKEFVKENGREMSEDEAKDAKRVARKKLKEEILAIAVLKRADKKRYGNLLIHLSNSYLLGNDDYPTTVGKVLEVLNNYEKEWTGAPQNPTNTRSERATAVSFLQTEGSPIIRFL